MKKRMKSVRNTRKAVAHPGQQIKKVSQGLIQSLPESLEAG